MAIPADVQAAIDALRAKQGVPNSIDPNYHADTLQSIVDVVYNQQVRELFVSNDGGDDANTGLAIISPKKTLNDAISTANSLVPPPSSADRVSITDLGSSIYNLSPDIIMPTGSLIAAPYCRIVGDDGVAIEANTDCNLIVGSVVPSGNGGTAVRLAGQDCNLTANSIRIGDLGNTQIGIRIVSQAANVNVDSILCSNSEGTLLLMDGTANASQPMIIDRMIMESFLCTAIRVNTTSTEPIVFNVGLIRDNGNANCLGLDVQSGNVKMTVNEMAADIQIDGGNTVSLEINRMEDANTITVDSGATLNIWCVEGNPTIVNNGTINGYIGGVYYGQANVNKYTATDADLFVTEGIDFIYTDLTNNPITLTLAENPEDGERKAVWMKNNINELIIESESPASPISPPSQIGADALQAQWILASNLQDNFTFNRDLTQIGIGGGFVPIVINGDNVDGFDFQGLVYHEANGYAGILGNSARSFTTWYQSNAVGDPTTDQTFISWGEDVADGGGSYWEVEIRGSQGYLWVNNRNASRRYNFTGSLVGSNLFDGNPHHIAVTQSTANMGSVRLFIDGVEYTRDFQDTYPACNTKSGSFLKVGAGYNGGQKMDGVMYDARIWNRGLSVEEVIQVRDQRLNGGLTVTGAPDNFLFEMQYSELDSQWIFGDGLPLFVQENRARIEQLEANQIPFIEDYPTNEIDPNLKLAPDALGGVEWVQDPLGTTFDSNLILDGNEVANRFVYVGNGNVNLTLPPSANTTLDYTIFIENKGSASATLTLLLDGADTLTGGNPLAIGDVSTVTKTTATNYNSDLVSPATTQEIESLQDSDIGLGTASAAAYPSASNVEAVLVLLATDALFGVSTDETLNGDGTVGNPLSVAGTKERLSTVMSADLVLNGTEQQLAFDPAQTSRSEGFTVNAGGSFTVASDGYYQGHLGLFVDKSGGAGVDLSIWVEKKPLATGVWELAGPSMANPVVFNDGGQTVGLNGGFDALAGDEFRVMVKENAGNATLTTETKTVNLGTINDYAASLSIHKVGPVSS